MTFEILMSCMHQKDDTLVRKSGITADVTVINQCQQESYEEYPTQRGTARIFSTCQRGLTKSRNMAIDKSRADICLICDDDEQFVPDYEQKILNAYAQLPQADVIIVKMVNRIPSFPDKVMRLRFPLTMKVSSWQISFRTQRLREVGVRFDELMGAGSGNGAEEELKFLLDCQKAGLRIYYVPVEIATVAQEESTWFGGFTQTFFENRGATTRYVLGVPLAILYGLYYVVRKKNMYIETITPWQAWKSTLKGIKENKIGKQARQKA